MTIHNALQQGRTELESAKIASSRLDSELLLAFITRQQRQWLLAHPEERLSELEQKQFFALIDRRSKRTPLAQLVGHREFFGLELKITSDVLTPRAETERIAELAIKYTPLETRLADIGTGSGALAIAIATHRSDLEIWATEISSSALEIARQNASDHRVRLKLVQSDLFQNPKLAAITFRTIVTNLPYLPNDSQLMPEVTKEPSIALFGGEGDGLNLYRRFLRELPGRLEPGGFLFTECDPWQQPDLIAEARKIGLSLIEEDYFVLGFRLAS